MTPHSACAWGKKWNDLGEGLRTVTAGGDADDMVLCAE